jgi:hypothetical protein
MFVSKRVAEHIVCGIIGFCRTEKLRLWRVSGDSVHGR